MRADAARLDDHARAAAVQPGGDNTVLCTDFTVAAGQTRVFSIDNKPDAAITATGTTFSASEGQNLTGKAATFTDADTNATPSEYSARVNWGDGSSSDGVITGGNGSFTVSGSHTYAEEGTYTTTVTITDVDTPANSATAKPTASVSDASLHATCGAPPVSSQSYNGPVAKVHDDAGSSSDPRDMSAAIDWGDGSASAGTLTAAVGGDYTVSGSHTYRSTGPFTITTTITDKGGSIAATRCKVLVYAFSPSGGGFVIGDNNGAVGTSVTFWGAQWWKLNSLSGGSAPAAFKGFALNPKTPACGVNWSTDPGNSAPPPTGPLPAYMAVIVSSSITTSGSSISGDTAHIVIVRTNPGYAPNPGHAGTGTVIAQVC